MSMTDEEHRHRHIELHKSLDELVADWIDHQGIGSDKFLSNTPIRELMEWSYQQTQNPTKPIRGTI